METLSETLETDEPIHEITLDVPETALVTEDIVSEISKTVAPTNTTADHKLEVISESVDVMTDEPVLDPLHIIEKTNAKSEVILKPLSESSVAIENGKNTPNGIDIPETAPIIARELSSEKMNVLQTKPTADEVTLENNIHLHRTAPTITLGMLPETVEIIAPVNTPVTVPDVSPTLTMAAIEIAPDTVSRDDLTTTKALMHGNTIESASAFVSLLNRQDRGMKSDHTAMVSEIALDTVHGNKPGIRINDSTASDLNVVYEATSSVRSDNTPNTSMVPDVSVSPFDTASNIKPKSTNHSTPSPASEAILSVVTLPEVVPGPAFNRIRAPLPNGPVLPYTLFKSLVCCFAPHTATH